MSVTPKSIGTRHTASARSNGRSNGSSNKHRYPYYALYIGSKSSELSLITGKIYPILRPLAKDPKQVVRVIDEVGEDYMYAAKDFVEVDIPAKAKRLLHAHLVGSHA